VSPFAPLRFGRRFLSSGQGQALARLRHMLEATAAIAGYVARGRAAYDADPAIRDAILYQIVVMGEAAKPVLTAEPTVEAELPAVEWSPIARMRDRVVHRYWATDAEIVWDTATRSVPEARTAIETALARLHQ
jgi:uncharacterized protein with HEPN domain